jgi:predicted outer membrane lipoprotein
MFDYSDGMWWFLAGLTLTAAFAVLTVVLALIARGTDRRRRS